jgi:hypothetical protein
MCPLIANNQCMLYDYRPMICRSHGIPHKHHHPLRGLLTGPGCHMFNEMNQKNDDMRFDRTPFYISIAQLEKRLRDAMQLREKVRMTVADMVAVCCSG